MKLSISLVTLALSTLASAYCVSPAIQASFAADQEVIVKSEAIRGRNQLDYCSNESRNNLIKLDEVNFDPVIPSLDRWLEVSIKGFAIVPLTPGIRMRITYPSGQEVAPPTELLSFLQSVGATGIPHIGYFHLQFAFGPSDRRILGNHVTFELLLPDNQMILCVKTPVML